MKESKTSKIVICENCKGEGTTYKRTYVDGGEDIQCDICGGHGRMKKEKIIRYLKIDFGNWV